MGVCVIVCMGVFVYGCMCMGTNPDTYVIKTMATRFKTVAIVMIRLFDLTRSLFITCYMIGINIKKGGPLN